MNANKILSGLAMVLGVFSGAAIAQASCPASVPSGVTTCYYIAASGSDSNNGTSESTPWLHAPMMPNCSGKCATVQNATLPAGSGLILRGGDTWHFGNSAAAPYTGGEWNFNVNPYPMGTSTNPIYVGVDQTWYSGSSWTRPILTGDNPVNASTTLTSCMYQIAGGNDFFELSGLQYYIIDNFEMTGLCQKSLGQPGHQDDYVSYGSIRGPMTFENLYIHGWSHVKFAGPNGSTSCTSSNVCFNIFAFQGGSQSETPADTIQNVVVDGSDSDGAGAGLCYGGFYNVFDSVFRYTSQCIVVNFHLFHDNLYEYFFENGHSNVLEAVAEEPGTNAVYNNIFRHLETSGSSGGVVLWPDPAVGTTDYFFNNLTYDEGPMELFNIGQNGSNQGTLNIFNNTLEMDNGDDLNCPPSGAFPFTVANNDFILGTASPYGTNCTRQQSTVTNIQMTQATATTDGYTASEIYAYSPIASNSATVGVGTNEQSFCTAISNAAKSDPTLSGTAAACQSDTGYACNYNTTNHTVSCPDRTQNPRPASAAWDAGTYQYSNTSSVQYGDLNGAANGQVTIYDAELVAQYVVGLTTLTPTQIQEAEVSSATETAPSIYDAFLIAEYAVGLITKFPVSGG